MYTTHMLTDRLHATGRGVRPGYWPRARTGLLFDTSQQRLPTGQLVRVRTVLGGLPCRKPDSWLFSTRYGRDYTEGAMRRSVQLARS